MTRRVLRVLVVAGTFALILPSLGGCSDGGSNSAGADLSKECEAACDQQAAGKDCTDGPGYASDCKNHCGVYKQMSSPDECVEATRTLLACQGKVQWACAGMGTVNGFALRTYAGTPDCRAEEKSQMDACYK